MNYIEHLKANAEGLIDVGKPAKALSVVFDALSQQPSNPDLLFILARVQMTVGLLSDAVATASQLVAFDPQNSRSHMMYALATSERWMLTPRRVRELSLPAAAEAVRLDPLSAEAHYFQALCLTRSVHLLSWSRGSTLARARLAVTEATRQEPGWVPPLLLLAHIEKVSGRRELARRYSEAALKLDPSGSDTLLAGINMSPIWRRRTLVLRLAILHPSDNANDLVLRTHKTLPMIVFLFLVASLPSFLGVADSVNFGQLQPGPEHLWVLGPFAGIWIAGCGLFWRWHSLSRFPSEVQAIVFDRERSLRWWRWFAFVWLATLPILWLPASVIGNHPTAWAVAWAFAGVIVVLLLRPRFGIKVGAE